MGHLLARRTAAEDGSGVPPMPVTTSHIENSGDEQLEGVASRARLVGCYDPCQWSQACDEAQALTTPSVPLCRSQTADDSGRGAGELRRESLAGNTLECTELRHVYAIHTSGSKLKTAGHRKSAERLWLAQDRSGTNKELVVRRRSRAFQIITGASVEAVT